MFSMRFSRFSARSCVSRTGTSVILALWCLLSLTSRATQALCLDGSGDCSPSAAILAASCHDRAPETDFTSSCDSCIDIIVPRDASAMHSRPDRDLREPLATQSLVAAHGAFDACKDGFATTVIPLTEESPLHLSLRTAVLRI